MTNPTDEPDPSHGWLPEPPRAGPVGLGHGPLPRLALLAMILVALLGGWWWGSRRPVDDQPLTPVAETVTTTTSGTMVVHVAGWVEQPGIVSLPAGSRIVDAVAAAGGVVPGGTLDGLNLAEPVVDGGRVEVPGPEGPRASGSVPARGGDSPLRVNTAKVSDLEMLPGVGPVLAARIVEHRESNGPFETVEDLLDVPGIGEATLDELRPLIAVP